MFNIFIWQNSLSLMNNPKVNIFIYKQPQKENKLFSMDKVQNSKLTFILLVTNYRSYLQLLQKKMNVQNLVLIPFDTFI